MNYWLHKRLIFSAFLKSLTCLFLATMCLTVKAQTNIVTGNIKDELGLAMPGVSVKVKGTTNGTVTDNKGHYSIKLSGVQQTLIFSFQGYHTQEINATGKTMVNVDLKPSAQNLSEVVVIGYGEVARKDLTGAVSSVKPTHQDAVQFTTVDELLKGRSPGVQVTTNSSAPGGIASVKIRGINSLRSDNEPLYVIDGIIVSTSTTDNNNPFGQSNVSGSGNAGQEAQNGLTGLNTQDIESIEVLKDASATAIYGSRGANGVVIITTKQGKAGDAQLTLSANTQISNPTRTYDVLDGKGFANYINDILLVRGNTVRRYDPDTVSNRNWQKELINTGIVQNYRLTASGGSKDKNTTYYVGTGFINSEGVIENTGSKQGDLRLTLKQRLTRKLDLNFTLSSVYQVNNMTTGTEPLGQATSSMIQQLVLAQPFVRPLTDANNEAVFANPISWVNDYDDISKELRFQGALSLSYEISPAFTYKFNIAGDSRNKDRERWYGPTTYRGSLVNGSLGKSNQNRTFYSVESLLMFKKGKKKHWLNGTVGITYNQEDNTTGSIVNERFLSPSLRGNGLGFGSDIYLGVPYRFTVDIFSVLARLNYTYNGKYLFTLTGRADGSSKFKDENSFSYFPSASFAWRINKENFLKNVKTITDMKWRLGFGMTGNQNIPAYSTFTRYNSTVYPNPAGGGILIGVQPDNIANEQLKWETTRQFNTGLDISLLDNNLSFTVDAYHKKTVDLLQSFTLPYSTGYQTIVRNFGSLTNKGLEFSVNASILNKGKFKWDANANISFNRNKIAELGLAKGNIGSLKDISYYLGGNVTNSPYFQTPANIFIEGQPIGLFFGFKTDGVYQNTTETTGNTFFGQAILPGDTRFVDQNGDKNITDDDKVLLGNPNPDFTYGFNLKFSYQKLSLNLFFNGSYGNDVVNANLIRLTNTDGAGNNILKESYYNAWTAANPTNSPRLNYTQTRFIDSYVEDGSFLRLSTANINYDLSIKNSKFIKNLTLSATARNLFIITKYSGYDPEVNSFGWDPTRVGVDWASYPNSRAFTFGINAKF